MTTRFGVTTLVAVIAWRAVSAQGVFTDAFPPDEFAARRAEVGRRIGDGVAIIQGATEYPAFVKFRQNNHFFYLSGVEVPRAILLIDGRTKTSTLYLLPRDERLERFEGPLLVPGDEAARLTGIQQVVPREQFAAALLRLGQDGRTVYTPFGAEALAGAPGPYYVDHAAASATDPWDGRSSREATFISKIRTQLPQLDLRNLDPILADMRTIKSQQEIALVREATQISGTAIMEAMRSASVGMYEYELEAIGDYIFKKQNARGPGYHALVATGQNAVYAHYHSAQSQLRNGDLVLYDYAPDYKYYTSDVTRMFPANGRFTADQRELYGTYVRLYHTLIESIRPGATQQQIAQDAVQKMDVFMASVRFVNPKNEQAARRFVDGFRHEESAWIVSHYVGMEVTDVGYPTGPLKAGMIFTVEPSLRIPDEGVYLRLEDVILITENGYEVLSGFVPIEIQDIERLMAEVGFAETARPLGAKR